MTHTTLRKTNKLEIYETDAIRKNDVVQHPVFLDYNNEKHLVFFRVENQPQAAEDNMNKILDKLVEDKGHYAVFDHTYPDGPVLMMMHMTEFRYKFAAKSLDELFTTNEAYGYTDFSGDILEDSHFWFRIFDKDLVPNVKKIAGYILSNQYDKADDVIAETPILYSLLEED